jgi:hypothetical protein
MLFATLRAVSAWRGCRYVLPVALGLMGSVAPSVAHAQPATVCKDGHNRAKVARDGGRLLEARKLLQQCSSTSCSASLQKECVGAVAEVEERLASVILSAENLAGVDLVDVAVSIDGKEGPRRLDGGAHDVDPGDHTFVFQLADGRKAERRISFRVGEKNKSVAVTIGAPAAPAVFAAEPDSTPSDAALAAAQPHSRDGSSSLKLAGFIAAGTGLAGLTVGTIFGLMASSTLSAPRCDTSAKVCDPGVIGDAKTVATASTIGFVAGSLLVAAGVTLVLLAPTRDNRARLGAAPAIGLNGGGLALHGSW